MLIQTKKHIILISWLGIIILGISYVVGAGLLYMGITFLNFKIRFPRFVVFIIFYLSSLLSGGIIFYIRIICKERINKYLESDGKKYILFIGELKERFWHTGIFLITHKKIFFIQNDKKIYIIYHSDILKIIIKNYFFLFFKIKIITPDREYIFVFPKNKNIISFLQHHLQGD